MYVTKFEGIRVIGEISGFVALKTNRGFCGLRGYEQQTVAAEPHALIRKTFAIIMVAGLAGYGVK